MVFDAAFYQAMLPQHIAIECQVKPEHVPVVELFLGDGTVVDVCHIVQLAEHWFSVARFRDPGGDDIDVLFLPYEAVVRVGLSLHPAEARRLGFDVGRSQQVVGAAVAAAGPAGTVLEPPHGGGG